jgi:hypothetical protein
MANISSAWGGRVAGFPSLGPAPHCGWDPSFDGAAAGGERCGAGRAHCHPSDCKGKEKDGPSEHPAPRHVTQSRSEAGLQGPHPVFRRRRWAHRSFVRDDEEDITALVLENEQLRRLVAAGRPPAAQIPQASIVALEAQATGPHGPDSPISCRADGGPCGEDDLGAPWVFALGAPRYQGEDRLATVFGARAQAPGLHRP